jgi:DNA-binding NarL/FixJ family response regulator
MTKSAPHRSAPRPIRILIADDHKLLRETLREALSTRGGFEVIAEAGDGREAVRLCGDLKPEVAVMDLDMPELNGVEAARRILEVSPGTRVVALTMYLSEKHVSAMFEAGAAGFVNKESAFEELERAIRTVAEGKTYLSPDAAQVAMKDYAALASGKAARGPGLGPREREVLQMLAEGKPVKTIAAALDLSVKTIENLRSRIMEKLGLDSVAGLTKYAIREGLTTLR